MKDMEKIEKKRTGTFDRTFYTEIRKLLAPGRK